MKAFKLGKNLDKGVSPILKNAPDKNKTQIFNKMIKIDNKNSEDNTFWDGLAKRKTIYDPSTRFISINLINDVWVYEWFDGNKSTDTIYDFVDYNLSSITNKPKKELKNYKIVGFNDENFIIKRGCKIKDSMARATNMRRREAMKLEFFSTRK